MTVFSAIADRFFTTANLIEIFRFSVELGLLAVALTPVIITGGIDLSVGSMMGLAAVVFGMACNDWKLSLPAAASVALLTGLAGGGLNALLISWLDLPPLIVTLGSFSLFRGIAEGMTHGAINYSDFPKRFLFLGQGYWLGLIPAQLPVFLLIVAGYIVLLHRSLLGRALYAIGFTASGARYAGIPVGKRIGLVYVLSGLVSSIAAIIYASHMGQVRSDAGTGYELDAITAVVLGGTSVFGGRGTLWGTLFGLFSLSILQNGLHLAALPSELIGVWTGALLIIVISIDGWARARNRLIFSPAASTQEFTVKNSQIAILCGTILAAALIVAVTNVWLVRSIAPGSAAVSSSRPVIAMMPKAKGDPYFVSVRGGAEEVGNVASASSLGMLTPSRMPAIFL